jgi:flagellar biosynthesis/type III secretory pathway protein FliH
MDEEGVRQIVREELSQLLNVSTARLDHLKAEIVQSISQMLSASLDQVILVHASPDASSESRQSGSGRSC